ncbi:MAG: hypothetical protein KDA75_08860 [Planctomycetaceae bacterium]|nr:hypothetical protein [Planctomycetaceae bacterium]
MTGYHLYPGRIDPEDDRLWELKIDIALPAAEQALGSREAALQLKQQFMEYLRDEETLAYSVLFSVVARHPAG